jgi:hypothetical protein
VRLGPSSHSDGRLNRPIERRSGVSFRLIQTFQFRLNSRRPAVLLRVGIIHQVLAGGNRRRTCRFLYDRARPTLHPPRAHRHRERNRHGGNLQASAPTHWDGHRFACLRFRRDDNGFAAPCAKAEVPSYRIEMRSRATRYELAYRVRVEAIAAHRTASAHVIGRLRRMSLADFRAQTVLYRRQLALQSTDNLSPQRTDPPSANLDGEDAMTEPHRATDERLHRIEKSTESLFRHCSESKNPVLAFSRACSKVGYLANDDVRDDLFFLTSALNEQKHALLQRRFGNLEESKKHAQTRDQEIRAFERAVRRRVEREFEPVPTADLRKRIDRNLQEGQWYRARVDLDELAKRPNIGGPLKNLAEYPRGAMLLPERYDELQARIDRCTSIDRDRMRDPNRAPSPTAEVASSSRARAVPARDERVATPTPREPHRPLQTPHARARSTGDRGMAR